MDDPRDKLVPEFHPLLPNPTLEEALAACETEEGRRSYAEFLRRRQERIDQADDDKGDPFRHGWYLPHWKRADLDLKAARKGQYVGGGKRATKSERAAWLVVKAMVHLPRTKIWALQGNMRTSVAEQQSLVWKYLPVEVKALNGRARHGMAKVDYTADRGFANNILVLPNRSELHFLSYDADPKAYQGWKLGAKINRELQRMMDGMPDLHNIGAWPDEDMPLPWFETIELRCASNDAKWLYTFSPMEGITPTITSILGTPETVESARAELLAPNRVHVPGCPPGEMPVRQKTSRAGVSIFYFWTEFNPFPPNYQNVKEAVAQKSEDQVKQDAYGYGKNVKARAHPKWGSWNIIKRTALPEVGTNYFIADPAGARMWAGIWVRVAPGNPQSFYVYRDFPSCAEFGPWAVIAPSNDDPDGLQGPAQSSRGFGWVAYKQLWLAKERINVPAHKLQLEPGQVWDDARVEALDAVLMPYEADPLRRRRIKDAVVKGEDVANLTEGVFDRLIDPRAGKAQKESAEGMTTPMDELAKAHLDPRTGELLAPALYFRQASGQSMDTGVTAINELLDWNTEQPMCSVINQPHLFVVEDCEQVIGCLNVFTGTGGEKAGWKDIHDLLRYMATSGLCYVPPENMRPRRGGCGY